jgi:integrase
LNAPLPNNVLPTALDAEDADPTSWSWPIPPQHFKVYDKYTDEEVSLAVDAADWVVPVQGNKERFEFLPGAHGQLQRSLIALTQSNSSPSTVGKFSRSLLKNWGLYCRALGRGPGNVKRDWDETVHDIDTAKAGKVVLRLACEVSVGQWQRRHLPLIRGLDTRAKRTIRAQRSKHGRREAIISVDAQAGVARVLDEGVLQQGLPEAEVDALTALALMFQHGVRPVQVIALRIEHVRMLRDAMGEANCIVSFHAAKRQDGKTIEMVRQMKPEWVGLMQQTLALAKQSGRRRVLSFSTREMLWTAVKRVCARSGVKVDFTAKGLRHTGAQSLADAGHDRASIRNFLGHGNDNAATVYVKASRKQAELINSALGASKLYGNILSLADSTFVSVEDMLSAAEDQQIGAVVGDRLVAGVGLCKTGQPNCPYNPVTSCYGCSKFMPSLDRTAHEEAVSGMREQVLVYVNRPGGSESPAYLQLMRALSGAQQALEAVDRITGGVR